MSGRGGLHLFPRSRKTEKLLQMRLEKGCLSPEEPLIEIRRARRREFGSCRGAPAVHKSITVLGHSLKTAQ